uniref:BTB domain-containing protein n=2 Tax=Panagrellus redivivus TaxID=6233 RepID=A0A7E4URE9_PANRE
MHPVDYYDVDYDIKSNYAELKLIMPVKERLEGSASKAQSFISVMMSFSDSDTICITTVGTTNAPRTVPGITGFKWLLRTSPGPHGTAIFYILTIRANVTIRAIFYSHRRHFLGMRELISVEDGDHQIYTLLVSPGKTIQCDVTFTVHWEKSTVFAPLGVYEMIDSSNPRCFDAVITVETQKINVHRSFLSMISPVFSAAFGPDTKETITGILDIKDFSFETVKNAINYCYGPGPYAGKIFIGG